MTLRLRIFLFNLISVFLATFVVALIGLKIVESTVIDNTYERLTQNRITKTAAIENYFRDLQTVINLISSHEMTEDFLLSKHPERHAEFRHLLDNYVLDFNIFDMALINRDGTIVYSTRKDVDDGISVWKELPSESKYKDLFVWGSKAQKGATLFLDFDQDTLIPQNASGFIATPIYRHDHFIGVLVLKISLSEIDRITSDNYAWASHGMGQTGEILIYGEDWSLRNTGRFRIENQQENNSNIEAEVLSTNRGDEDIKKIEANSDVREIGTDYRGKKVIRSIGKIYLPNGELWYIQAKMDESEAFAVLDRIAIASSAAAVLIFILFFFATFAATGKVVEPIQLLTDRLEKLGTNNLSQKINYHSNDEIGLLVSKYNQVANRLETTTVSKDFLDSVIQSIKAFLFIVKIERDDSGYSFYKIIQANESAMHLLGLSESQLPQIDFKDLIRSNENFADPHWLLQTRHSVQIELTSQHHDAIPVLMNWSALPHHTNRDQTFVFVCTDITDRIQAERALIEAREQAVKASQAKSEFLARMSHEIRTPLNAIIGITDILAESDLKTEQAQLVKVCANAGENLLSLINDILDISKIEAREVRIEKIAFDLVSTTQNICDILKQKAAEKSIQFNLNIDLPPHIQRIVVGDPTRLRQILFNLIGNALKFTQTGSINVNLRIEENQGRKNIHFTIKDTGNGIPLDKQHLLFQNFVQADSSITRRYGGTGLGLTISKNLVELMSGKIGFESKEGEGSTFYFSIPYTPAEETSLDVVAVNSKISSAANDKAMNQNAKILIVDDSEDNRFLLLTYLKKYPFDIAQAENGLEAVQKAKQSHFDVILMDIQMPVMDGYAATQTIREWEKDQHLKPTPIIAISANAMAEDIKKSLDIGCTEHVTKPVKKSTLIELIQRYTI